MAAPGKEEEPVVPHIHAAILLPAGVRQILCRMPGVSPRATRASRIFRADEKRIRAENTVMEKDRLGLVYYKTTDCVRMCFSSARNR
ncbi:MAG: hypothetical protein IH606_21215 [Burkholderiales bacterium]|nr:hypothetical protein [Burkholderiales bacterium]